MGSDRHYSEEAPAREVTVGAFWMDPCTVANAEFARFVAETIYVTVAERPVDPALYPGAKSELLVPSSVPADGHHARAADATARHVGATDWCADSTRRRRAARDDAAADRCDTNRARRRNAARRHSASRRFNSRRRPRRPDDRRSSPAVRASGHEPAADHGASVSRSRSGPSRSATPRRLPGSAAAGGCRRRSARLRRAGAAHAGPSVRRRAALERLARRRS